jgi:hypothetical protein
MFTFAIVPLEMWDTGFPVWALVLALTIGMDLLCADIQNT